MDFTSAIDGLILLLSGVMIVLFSKGVVFSGLTQQEQSYGLEKPTFIVGAIMAVIGFVAIIMGVL
ncbi:MULTISPECIES: hypothetical protein [Pseudoalteromonas]|uniref:Uncharacterized protein n=2 Tax=Pseudoalteromonas TaxID=53246 RepID=V4J845_PSEL2|nr:MULTISPECIES: hypothetical protein [Pseudoalteromonas]ESP91417.1 hypothetical protein PL2TA16_00216 [Pseudoalteromonas luteoviolacea 2ta16]KZN40064.1 hypothetical protein N483_17915 [Pseudoalteromonas luteoviolacea NCIMB 1944]MDK2593963.1 hypothetical protein [Pseudoalteromonas sp. P94(2023)]